MLLSMTGFGEAHRNSSRLAIGVEVRTINSRHFKLSLRTGEGYATLEPQIDATVRARVKRGTVQLNLRVVRHATGDDYRLNGDVLASYQRQLGQLSPDRQIPVESLLALPGVIEEQRDPTQRYEDDWPEIEPVIIAALDALATMRQAEGAALADDLRANARVIGECRFAIERRSPNVQVSYRERLTERVNKALSELNVTVQPVDLVREIALFVDRSDISEELVRLASHLDQFELALGLAESSGRKLEFIAQEMGREINTIGSKANDTEIGRHVVEMKTRLERIREQVQNVE